MRHGHTQFMRCTLCPYCNEAGLGGFHFIAKQFSPQLPQQLGTWQRSPNTSASCATSSVHVSRTAGKSEADHASKHNHQLTWEETNPFTGVANIDAYAKHTWTIGDEWSDKKQSFTNVNTRLNYGSQCQAKSRNPNIDCFGKRLWQVLWEGQPSPHPQSQEKKSILHIYVSQPHLMEGPWCIIFQRSCHRWCIGLSRG